MKCPECGREMEKGTVQASDAGHLIDGNVMLTWCPEDQKGKMFPNGVVNLRIKADGYYCDECMKVFAAFEEK